MRTEEINVYRFEELSDKAKEKARDWYRSIDFCDDSAQEIWDSWNSMIGACNGIKPNNNSRVYRFELENPDHEDIHGPRAMAWIENNLLYKLIISYTGEYRVDCRKYGNLYYAGKIKPCTFTGMCYDDDLLDYLLKQIRAGHTLQESFYYTQQHVEALIEADNEYRNSDEYIDESMIANDYEFTVTGNHY